MCHTSEKKIEKIICEVLFEHNPDDVFIILLIINKIYLNNLSKLNIIKKAN